MQHASPEGRSRGRARFDGEDRELVNRQGGIMWDAYMRFVVPPARSSMNPLGGIFCHSPDRMGVKLEIQENIKVSMFPNRPKDGDE